MGPRTARTLAAMLSTKHPVLQRRETPHTHSVMGGSIAVRLRAGETGGRLGTIENVVPPGFGNLPLHVHPDFDEAFYVLEGELTFLLGGELVTVGAGGLAFAPGGEPHAFTNRGAVPARYLLTFTPAGFEREFARRAARKEGIDPPEWALQEIPHVTMLGPPIGAAG
jgi:uncharacterized cupin superfamily protein